MGDRRTRRWICQPRRSFRRKLRWRWGGVHRFWAELELRAAVLEDALFQLLLAGDAVAGPGHGVQTLGIDLVAARDALAKVPLANAVKGAVDHLQQLAVGVALVEEELLVVGIGRAIGNVLRRLQIGVTAVLSGPGHGGAQLPLTLLQPLLECL